MSYKISTGTAALENYRFICRNWLKTEKAHRTDYVSALKRMPKCPCTSWFLFFDRRFENIPWWGLSTSTFTISLFPRRVDLPYGKVLSNLKMNLSNTAFIYKKH